MAAAVEAVFASVNPDVVKSEQLREKVVAALEETLRLQNPDVILQRAVYNGIGGLFEALQKANAGEDAAAGQATVDALKGHLFRADAGSEAIRLQRVDAIRAVVEYSSFLASSLRPDILTLKTDERSTLVRERLQAVMDRKA